MGKEIKERVERALFGGVHECIDDWQASIQYGETETRYCYGGQVYVEPVEPIKPMYEFDLGKLGQAAAEDMDRLAAFLLSACN